MVEGPGAVKQVQPLWQDQQQWAFALDIAEGQANAHPSLQLPSLPGLDTGMLCNCLVTLKKWYALKLACDLSCNVWTAPLWLALGAYELSFDNCRHSFLFWET